MQALAPGLSWKLPALHASQLDCPVSLAKVPALQLHGGVCPPAHQVLTGHGTQSLMPLIGLYFPVSHGEHSGPDCPSEQLYVVKIGTIGAPGRPRSHSRVAQKEYVCVLTSLT